MGEDDRPETIESLISRLQAEMRRAQTLDQLRNSDGEKIYVLEQEVARLREVVTELCRENDYFRGVLASRSFAKPGQVCVQPRWGARRLGTRNNSGFLIMPFRPEWSRSVAAAVEEAFSKVGMSCRRADQLLGDSIMSDVWEGICDCGVVIADITDSNPNVLYELGLAHALGRDVIPVSQTDESQSIPFDLLGQRLVVYKTESLAGLTASLCGRLKGLRESSRRPAQAERLP